MKDEKNGRYGSKGKKAMWPTLGYYIVEKKILKSPNFFDKMLIHFHKTNDEETELGSEDMDRRTKPQNVVQPKRSQDHREIQE